MLLPISLCLYSRHGYRRGLALRRTLFFTLEFMLMAQIKTSTFPPGFAFAYHTFFQHFTECSDGARPVA